MGSFRVVVSRVAVGSVCLLAGLVAACSSSTVAAPADAAVAEDTGAVEDAGLDTAVACTGVANDACAECEVDKCCELRVDCLADAACKTAREELDACIASTEAGTPDRHSCFMSFEKKGKKALALHLCGEKNCRAANACAIP
ncbi:MAG: hypothetical protein JWM74_1716 [Myxococcaceae bacterium]|nr:hypothetical protein [Myxococcaceae bacterium]